MLPVAVLLVFGCDPEVPPSPDLRIVPGCDGGCTPSRCVQSDMGAGQCVVSVVSVVPRGTFARVHYV